MIKCQRCGFDNRDGGKFCVRCGNSLAEQTVRLNNQGTAGGGNRNSQAGGNSAGQGNTRGSMNGSSNGSWGGNAAGQGTGNYVKPEKKKGGVLKWILLLLLLLLLVGIGVLTFLKVSDGSVDLKDPSSYVNIFSFGEGSSKTKYNITVNWSDDDDKDGIRPGMVTVKVMDGMATADTVIITEADGWTGKSKALPSKDGKTEIRYTVSAAGIDGYETEVGYAVYSERTKAYEVTITNRHSPEPTITYEVFMADVTWQEAKALCESKGGKLATIHSAEEQRKIEELLNSYGYHQEPDEIQKKFWIGCSRIDRYTGQMTGEYKWISGDENVTYSNWGPGSPSYYWEHKGTVLDENCVVLEHSGNGYWDWNDINERFIDSWYNVNRIGYICQYER